MKLYLIENRSLSIATPVIVGVVIVLAIFLQVFGAQPLAPSSQPILTRVESISYWNHNHIHGLGYDSQNERLFVATHYGIFIWANGQLFQLGHSRYDFMGFSLHPQNPSVIYTSGHPTTGGNMGVMKSEDGGASFKRIFQGLKGEAVDFHSMTISPANPNILYGWFQQKLYLSKDGGKTWQVASAKGLAAQGFCFGAPCLSADSKDERIIYAGVANGLLVSRDLGENWTLVNSQLGAVAAVAVDPSDPKRLFAFTQNLGVALSQDGEKKWHSRNKGIELARKEIIFAFVLDGENSMHLFAATPEKIFRSTDGGQSWKKIL